jgi:hypothetical protein
MRSLGRDSSLIWAVTDVMFDVVSFADVRFIERQSHGCLGAGKEGAPRRGGQPSDHPTSMGA